MANKTTAHQAPNQPDLTFARSVCDTPLVRTGTEDAEDEAATGEELLEASLWKFLSVRSVTGIYLFNTLTTSSSAFASDLPGLAVNFNLTFLVVS
jgi:hypothetical protein